MRGRRNETGQLQSLAELTNAKGRGGGGTVRMRSEIRIFNTEMEDKDGVRMDDHHHHGRSYIHNYNRTIPNNTPQQTLHQHSRKRCGRMLLRS